MFQWNQSGICLALLRWLIKHGSSNLSLQTLMFSLKMRQRQNRTIYSYLWSISLQYNVGDWISFLSFFLSFFLNQNLLDLFNSDLLYINNSNNVAIFSWPTCYSVIWFVVSLTNDVWTTFVIDDKLLFCWLHLLPLTIPLTVIKNDLFDQNGMEKKLPVQFSHSRRSCGPGCSRVLGPPWIAKIKQKHFVSERGQTTCETPYN